MNLVILMIEMSWLEFSLLQDILILYSLTDTARRQGLLTFGPAKLLKFKKILYYLITIKLNLNFIITQIYFEVFFSLAFF